MYVTLACVVCDEPVLSNQNVLNSTPSAAALCNECDQQVPWSLLSIIYKLRSQVSWLMAKLQMQ